MKPWQFLVLGILIAGGIWAHGNWHGSRQVKAEYEFKIAEANRKALITKEAQQAETDKITRRFNDEKDSITRERDAALLRLRDRANRMPKTTATDCAGENRGSFLARNGENLIDLASRADKLRNALQACYDYADSLQK